MNLFLKINNRVDSVFIEFYIILVCISVCISGVCVCVCAAL